MILYSERLDALRRSLAAIEAAANLNKQNANLLSTILAFSDS
jgi:hypothetical protein